MWTENEVWYLNQKAGKSTAHEIAEVLGKSTHAVNDYAHKRGISLAVPIKYEVTIDGYTGVMDIEQASKLTGYVPNTLYRLASSGKTVKAHGTRWHISVRRAA